MRAAIEERGVCLITSDPLQKELIEVLQYPRLRRYLRMSLQEISDFVILLEQIAELVSIESQPAPGICRDPDDEPYLQTAMAGRADYLVSGDDDLLSLREVEDIPIVTPAELKALERNRE